MIRVIVVMACIACLVGCAAQVIHPGTANSFDSGVYDTLLTTDSVIQSTKADLAANKFPATIVGNVKTALNALIAAYNVADTFYCGQPVGNPMTCSAGSYHALAMAGMVTPTATTQMNADLTTVNIGITNLTSAKGGQ